MSLQKQSRAEKICWGTGLYAESENVQLPIFLFVKGSFSYILSSEEKINWADDVCQSCWSARRAWMMTLKVIVRESKDSQRGRCPPISDGAPPSSFHSSTDGLKTEEQWGHPHERGGRPSTFANRHLISAHLRRWLQISKWNDFFVDKKLDGLLLPVIHVAVQFVCVHSCRGRMTLAISCSYRGSGGAKVWKGCSHLLLAQDGRSSVPGRSAEPSPCSDGTPPSWPFACPPAPTHTHKKQDKEHFKKKNLMTKRENVGQWTLLWDKTNWNEKMNSGAEPFGAFTKIRAVEPFHVVAHIEDKKNK